MPAGASETDQNFVLLSGGPPDLPRVYRLPVEAAECSEKIAVAYYGRHEHFERTNGSTLTDWGVLRIFQWSYSTKIAE
ncbi:DUF5988 family protein [Streptomyces sp. NPDC003952]